MAAMDLDSIANLSGTNVGGIHPTNAHLERPALFADKTMQSPGDQTDLLVVDKLKFFLATAPSTFNPSSTAPPTEPCTGTNGTNDDQDQHRLRRFRLPNREHISCVLWNGLYHITGTDVIRTLVFRLRVFGRRISNMKKFEEGVFSDLRSLKAGIDATLEVAKSPFLDLLFKQNCIRTQKKQKVFYWYSVPHDELFLDALERDARREKLGQDPSSVAVAEPALSFSYNAAVPLLGQLKARFDDHHGNPVTGGRPATEQAAFSLPFLHYHSYPSQNQETAVEPQPLTKIAGSIYSTTLATEDDRCASTSFYNPERASVCHTKGTQSGTAAMGNPIDIEGQLSSRSYFTTSSPFNICQQEHSSNQLPAPSGLPVSQAVAASGSHASSSEQCSLEHPLGTAEKIRFICPWYSCGHLFTYLSQLLQHLQLHTGPLGARATSTKTQSAPITTTQQAALACEVGETAALLDVLNQTAISTQRQSPPGYMRTGVAPSPSTCSLHEGLQGASEAFDEPVIVIAPAPSIRRRGD